MRCLRIKGTILNWRWIAGVTVLVLVGLSILFGFIPLWLFRESIAVFPFTAPYVVYAAFGIYLFRKDRLFEVLRDPVQMELEKQQAASLTLSGFCFTSLGLLVSFFKEEIKRREPGPHEIIKFFGVALGCFIFSYMVLRYRGRRFFSLLSDASIDNGLWCILVGLQVFSKRTPGLEGLPFIFLVVIAGYVLHLALNFYYYIHAMNQPSHLFNGGGHQGHGGGHS